MKKASANTRLCVVPGLLASNEVLFMNTNPPVIFEKDERFFRFVNRKWTRENILSMDGIFYLKDIAAHLELDTNQLRKIIKSIRRRKEAPYKKLGIGKIWGHWIVRMHVFSECYRTNSALRVKKIPANWDGNTLLSTTGTYALTEVCRLIPFPARQLRYQAIKNPNSKEEYGIWKDPMLNKFLVDMALFSTWIISLWKVSPNEPGRAPLEDSPETG